MNNPEDPRTIIPKQSMTRKTGRLLSKVIFTVFMLLLIAVLTLLFVWVAFTPTGIDPDSDISTTQASQIIFWAALLTGILLYLLQRVTQGRTVAFLRWTHKVVRFTLPFVVIGGIGLAIGLNITGAKEINKHKAAACSMDKTLDDAIYSTYAITTEKAAGTGFIVNAEGHMVTAYHVIEGAKQITTWTRLTPDGELTKVSLSVLKTAPDYDLALLKMDHPVYAHLALAKASDLPGEKVYAVGYPNQALDAGSASVSGGVVSRTITADQIEDSPKDMVVVQTDAAINPGNSGGPLINACGVVGITSAISDTKDFYGLSREEGIGYTVSSETAKAALGLK